LTQPDHRPNNLFFIYVNQYTVWTDKDTGAPVFNFKSRQLNGPNLDEPKLAGVMDIANGVPVKATGAYTDSTGVAHEVGVTDEATYVAN